MKKNIFLKSNICYNKNFMDTMKNYIVPHYYLENLWSIIVNYPSYSKINYEMFEKLNFLNLKKMSLIEYKKFVLNLINDLKFFNEMNIYIFKFKYFFIVKNHYYNIGHFTHIKTRQEHIFLIFILKTYVNLSKNEKLIIWYTTNNLDFLKKNIFINDLIKIKNSFEENKNHPSNEQNWLSVVSTIHSSFKSNDEFLFPSNIIRGGGGNELDIVLLNQNENKIILIEKKFLKFVIFDLNVQQLIFFINTKKIVEQTITNNNNNTNLNVIKNLFNIDDDDNNNTFFIILKKIMNCLTIDKIDNYFLKSSLIFNLYYNDVFWKLIFDKNKIKEYYNYIDKNDKHFIHNFNEIYYENNKLYVNYSNEFNEIINNEKNFYSYNECVETFICFIECLKIVSFIYYFFKTDNNIKMDEINNDLLKKALKLIIKNFYKNNYDISEFFNLLNKPDNYDFLMSFYNNLEQQKKFLLKIIIELFNDNIKKIFEEEIVINGGNFLKIKNIVEKNF